MNAYQSSNLKKGVKYFTNSLEKSLLSIGKEMNKPRGSGKRKKIGKLIPVQVTAKSRREYKHRGRVVGTAGRRLKDQEERRQLVVSENEENVYHTLPKQNKKKNKLGLSCAKLRSSFASKPAHLF